MRRKEAAYWKEEPEQRPNVSSGFGCGCLPCVGAIAKLMVYLLYDYRVGCRKQHTCMIYASQSAIHKEYSSLRLTKSSRKCFEAKIRENTQLHCPNQTEDAAALQLCLLTKDMFHSDGLQPKQYWKIARIIRHRCCSQWEPSTCSSNKKEAY